MVDREDRVVFKVRVLGPAGSTPSWRTWPRPRGSAARGVGTPPDVPFQPRGVPARAAPCAATCSSRPARPAPLRSTPARQCSPSLHPLAHFPAGLRASFPSRAAGRRRGSPGSAGVVPAPPGPAGRGRRRAAEGSRIASCARAKPREFARISDLRRKWFRSLRFSGAPQAAGSPSGSERVFVRNNDRVYSFGGRARGCQDGRVV